MTTSARRLTRPEHSPSSGSVASPLPRDQAGWPILFEDEDDAHMGESSPHVSADEILHLCVEAHLAGKTAYRVFSNMNCYYRPGPRHPRTGALPYVSPDLMVVKPKRRLGRDVSSYTIGKDGPPPVLVGEVLSERSAQQRDLAEKIEIYAGLGIKEYLLADTTGRFLPQKLLIKRLARGSYADQRDADGGITSKLGFRVVIDGDGGLRVLAARTGKRYPRPNEIGLLAAEIERLRAEIEQLKGKPPRRR